MCLDKQCLKCGGDLFLEQYPDGASLECVQCGWTLPLKRVPLRTEKMVSIPGTPIKMWEVSNVRMW